MASPGQRRSGGGGGVRDRRPPARPSPSSPGQGGARGGSCLAATMAAALWRPRRSRRRAPAPGRLDPTPAGQAGAGPRIPARPQGPFAAAVARRRATAVRSDPPGGPAAAGFARGNLECIKQCTIALNWHTVHSAHIINTQHAHSVRHSQPAHTHRETHTRARPQFGPQSVRSTSRSLQSGLQRRA